MGNPVAQSRVPQSSAWAVVRKTIAGFPDVFRDDPPEWRDGASLSALPETGELVSVSGRSGVRVGGRVVGGDAGRIFVEVEAHRSSFRRRARLALEWVDPLGMVRRRGRLASASPGGGRIVEIEFTEPPFLIQRREELRVGMKLKVSAWSFHAWTRLLEGETLDLSESGALLRLPNLPKATTRIELRLALPDRPLGLTARVVRRDDADAVAVAFEGLAPQAQDRLREVLLPELFPQGRSAVAAA